jgi:membrane fusion protein, multidrug efflux system
MKRIILSGVILLAMTACSDKNPAAKASLAENSIAVKVEKARLKEYTPSLELSGTAYADREANLGAALPGRVEKTWFPAGASVKKGDLLVSLSGELYTQALVEFNTIEKDYERVSRLNDKGSISQQEYDHVKAMFDASRVRVEMMKKNAEIVAPFSGTITEYLVQEGENYFFNLNLDPGYSTTSGILRLMKLDPIQVEVEVNEKDLYGIKTGQKALLRFDAIRDSLFTGSVSSIKPSLSALTHSATIRIKVDNGSGILKPGMFAHVNIQFKSVQSVCVPSSAVYREPGVSNQYIFIADNNRAKKININPLWSNDSWIAVTGISEGQVVVTSGKDKLVDGSLIEIK